MSSDLPSNTQEMTENNEQTMISSTEVPVEVPSSFLPKENEETQNKGEEQKDPFLEGIEIPPQPSSFTLPNIIHQEEISLGENQKETNEMEEEEEEEDDNSGEINGKSEENANIEEEEIDSVTGEKRKRVNDDDWKPSSPGSSQIPLGKKKTKKIQLKKKPKIKKIPEVGESEGEKMSFQRKSLQEAAVQILGEQREKGVYALSTRRIWELISQSGLVDTKCKTPVSSLSSRITEDVRTKGNKSVFVRVGEGLYTLRKGLKKQDIERYLNTKYPNMPHGSDLEHQFSEEEPEESSNLPNNNNNQPSNPTPTPIEATPTATASSASFSDQFAKILQENRESSKEQSEVKKNPQVPRQIPVRFTKPTVGSVGNNANLPIPHGNAAAAAAHFVAKAMNANTNNSNGIVKTGVKLPTVLNAKSLLQESENNKAGKVVQAVPQIKLKEIKWVGLPLKKKKDGDVYYSSVKVENNTFRIGDCIYFESSLHGDEVKDKGVALPYIGRITKLFQTNSKARMKAHGGTMLVECVWYFYPEDTRTGRRKKHHKREVFLSNLSDVNNVNTIKGPVQVLSFPEFNQVVNSPSNSAEEIPADIFLCRSFYDEVSTSFHPLSLDHKTGNFQFSDVNNHAQNRVKNWPKEVEFTSRSVWGEISGGVKELLDTKHKPYVKLEPLNSTNQTNNNSTITNALFAATFLSEGTILGDFQGVVVNNTEEAASHHDPNGSIRTLYEDHEVLVSIDVSESGNEFRFMRDVSMAKNGANVKLCTVYLDGKWHLLVQTIKTISKDEEIVVDLSESSMPDLEGFIEENAAVSSPEPMVLSSTRNNLLENDRLFNYEDPPKLVKAKRVQKNESFDDDSLKNEESEVKINEENQNKKEEEIEKENAELHQTPIQSTLQSQSTLEENTEGNATEALQIPNETREETQQTTTDPIEME